VNAKLMRRSPATAGPADVTRTPDDRASSGDYCRITRRVNRDIRTCHHPLHVPPAALFPSFDSLTMAVESTAILNVQSGPKQDAGIVANTSMVPPARMAGVTTAWLPPLEKSSRVMEAGALAMASFLTVTINRPPESRLQKLPFASGTATRSEASYRHLLDVHGRGSAAQESTRPFRRIHRYNIELRSALDHHEPSDEPAFCTCLERPEGDAKQLGNIAF